MSNQDDIVQLIRSISGQANILTIPRVYIAFVHSHRAALFLSQCVYWSDRSVDGWFYKSFREWLEELGLNQHAIETCVKLLKDGGWLETRLGKVGTRNVTFYRPNMKNIAQAVIATLAETAKVDTLAETANVPKRKTLTSSIKHRLPTETTGEGEQRPPTPPSFCEDVSQPVTNGSGAQETPQGAKGGNGAVGGGAGAPAPPAPRGKRQGGNGGKTPDPLLSHPAVVAYRDAAHLTPNDAARAEIAKKIGDDDAVLQAWARNLNDWMLRGWNPRNVAGMLDRMGGGNGKGNLPVRAGGRKDNGDGTDRGRAQEIIERTQRARAELAAITDPAERERRWREMHNLPGPEMGQP